MPIYYFDTFSTKINMLNIVISKYQKTSEVVIPLQINILNNA